MRATRQFLVAPFCAVLLACPAIGNAAASFTVTNASADSFLSGSAPMLNYGAAGTLAIAPASSPKGEFTSVIKFSLAGAVGQFNTTFGANNWQISGLTLRLASSFGTDGAIPGNNNLNTVSGGNFGITWLAGDGWTEGSGGGSGAANGAVSFSTIASLFAPGSESLGTFTYAPPGNNAYAGYALPLMAGLLSDATTGGDVSLYFSAADNQVSYLFNSRSFSAANPQLVVTAIPEPGTPMLIALGSLLLLHRRVMQR